MRTIRIGELRHQLVFQTPVRVASGDGETETWPTLLTVWAAIAPAGAGAVERLFGTRLQTPVSSLVTVRHRDELTPAVLQEARCLFGSRVLQIQGWQHVDERGRWLVLACKEEPA